MRKLLLTTLLAIVTLVTGAQENQQEKPLLTLACISDFTLSASQTKAMWNLEVAVEEQADRRQRQGHKRIKVLNT